MLLNRLIKGCQQNDRKSQEVIYRRYFSEMWRMCSKYTQDEDRLISIINDGFLKVFKHVGDFNGSGSFEGWIRRIVYRALSDHFRKENKYLKFLVFESYDTSTRTVTADEDLYLSDLQKIIETLPSMSKQVFTLFAIEGYTHKEIGVLLDIKEGTSKWHLNQARQKLKKLILTTQNELKHG